MFVGREKILKTLEEKYKEEKGHLLVLYGKRRSGKTALLKEFSKNKKHFFYFCRETIDSEQIKLFSKEILNGNPIQSYLSSFDNWEKAFMFLINESKKKKILLIVDEFPYMAQNNKSILSIIQKIWDIYGNKTNLMCILTGSSLSYIEKEMLSETSPIFGRTTGIIKIESLTFKESQNILKNFSINEQIAYYSFLGGIPRYLKIIDSSKNIGENIKKYFLNKFSFLYQEIDFLIREELREPSTYYAILSSIAEGSEMIKDIAKTTNLDKTKINVYIKNLMQLKILSKKVPLLLPNEKINHHRNIYLLKEPYFKFYFRFIVPNLSQLENNFSDIVLSEKILPKIDKYIEEFFQYIAIENLREKNSRQLLNKYYQQIGYTWNNKVKLPIFGFTKNGDLLAGQAFYKRLPTINEINEIKQKLTIYIKNSCTNTNYYFYITKKANNSLLELSKLDKQIHFIKIN